MLADNQCNHTISRQGFAKPGKKVAKGNLQSMFRDVNLVFHNQGLRSYIELDLCPSCPRQDDKGCCAYYSPVFYPLDFGFWLEHQPDMIDTIFAIPNITVLDTSVTVNNYPEGNSYRCRFHSKETGCYLPQGLRESVCRQFICPGVGWWDEPALSDWNDFFTELAEYEAACNQRLGTALTNAGLSLRHPENRTGFFQTLLPLYRETIAEYPAFFSTCPEKESITLNKDISAAKQAWRL